MKNISLILTLLFTALLSSVLIAAPIKTIHFATEATYPPFESIDESGQIKGFDVDIAHALCLEIKVQCKITNQSFASLIPSLQLGKFDAVIAALGITEERKKQVAFTNSYYEPSASFVASIAKHYTIADLSGKTIGVQEGTTFAKYLQEKYGDKITIKSYASIQDALLDLSSDRIDAVLGDAPIVRAWLKSPSRANARDPELDNSKTFAVVGEPIVDPTFGVGSGIAVRKDNIELLNALNQALATIKANGTYQKIYQKYFGG